MKTPHNNLSPSKEMHPQALLRHPAPYLWHVSRALLMLTMVCTSCGTNVTPPPGPPASAEGQAILAWGGNSTGQIGDGSTFQRLTPTFVALKDKNIAAVAAGGNFGLALTVDGSVLEWGGGKTTPTEVTGLTSVKAIAAGLRHRLALKDDGTVWAWGDNDRGQIGDNSNSPRPTPVQVVGLDHVLGIAAGGQHSLAIRHDLGVWAWGANDKGQLGDGTTADRLTPVAVPGIQAITVAASATHTIIVTPDVKVMGWGSNSSCQLGVDPRSALFDPITCSDHVQPTLVRDFQSGSTNVSTKGRAIAAIDSMTLIVLADGTVLGLGGAVDPNQFLGICNPDAVLGPAYVPGLPAVEEVVGGTKHALFRTAAGEVWSLGANSAGQDGLGTTSVQECAHAIPSATARGASQLAAGQEHSLALIKGLLSVTPSAIDLGSQPVGTSSASPQEVTISNDGLAPVTFYDISNSGFGDFSFTEDCPDTSGVLAAGANCRIGVTFAPTAPGLRVGQIRLTHDGQGRQQDIALSGIATEAKVSFAPDVIDFGVQTVGTTSAAQTVTIRNAGDAPLLINTIEAFTGFEIVTDSCQRAPNAIPVQGTCTVDVAFVPLQAKPTKGELRVTYAPDKSDSMELKGAGQ